MAAERLHLTVATPERPVVTDEVDEVVIPGAQGEFGVLPGHTTLLAELGSGRLVVRKGSEQREFQISGGFAEVRADQLLVLADSVNQEK